MSLPLIPWLVNRIAFVLGYYIEILKITTSFPPLHTHTAKLVYREQYHNDHIYDGNGRDKCLKDPKHAGLVAPSYLQLIHLSSPEKTGGILKMTLTSCKPAVAPISAALPDMVDWKTALDRPGAPSESHLRTEELVVSATRNDTH